MVDVSKLIKNCFSYISSRCHWKVDQAKKNSNSSNHRLHLKIVTQFFPPDFAATGQFVEELAERLSQQKMDVHVFTGMPGYAYVEEEALRIESRGNFTITRTRVSRWGNRHFLGRMLRGILFCLRTSLHLCYKQNRGDLLLFVSEPPYLQSLGYLIHILFSVPYACLVYDLYPEVAVELSLVSERHWIVRLWNLINRAVWSRASVIIVPSDTMRERIVQRFPGLAVKIVVIHNWADANWIKPVEKKNNDFAREHDLVNHFTVLYSGNMGRCHDMNTILDAAVALQEESIQFVFIGGGPKQLDALHRVESLGLKNCKFLPYQERSLLPQSLTACDLALVSIAKGMEGLVAPSKFYSAMASGRPIAVICESHSYLRQMVADARCGAAFSNGDGIGLAAFIRHLSRDPALGERLGEAGHLYVAQHFTPQRVSEQYRRVLEQSVLSNAALKRAIKNQEFCLYYQPIFSLSTGTIQGFEALLRWQKGPDQFLLPNDFLPKLESSGWLADVTPWIFQEAASQLKQWQTIYATCPQYLRLNLSVSQFFDTQLLAWIEQYWLNVGLSGSSLGFDISEAVLMNDPAGAIAVLLRLKERGIKIYLDGFGSGVASLQSLHQFPLDGLALDRTLIATIDSKHNNLSLLNTLIALGETLEVPLHAEGIATAEQLQKLKSLGFHLGQGAFLAPPMEAALASQMLADNYQHLLNAPVYDSMATQFHQEFGQTDKAPHVLVVDDNDIMRKVLNRFLRSEGFQVIEAANAQQALEIFQLEFPQIVLLDAIMPGMDGFECCSLMNQMRLDNVSVASKSQIFLLTSRDDEDSVNLAFASGADDYLTKPVNWAILRQRLSKYSQNCQSLVAA